MQTPSEPQQAGAPPAAIAASSSMGEGGPAEYYKHLLTLMETPAVPRQAVTSRALVPAPFAAEEPSREESLPSPAPPPEVPSTPPATARAPLPRPAKSEEVVQILPPAVLPVPAKEEQLSAINFYRIGSEDVIRISVWENPELTMDVTVRPDGNISLPLIHDVHAADLTPIELSDVISQNLKKFMKDPHVAVIVAQSNSQKIYLVGNVLRPGAFPLRHDMTVLHALSLAGGFTTFASPREMKLISGIGTKQEIRKINYYKMIEDIELGYYMLKPGDTIVIP
jgi:polysaccharide export outer membrane protein